MRQTRPSLHTSHMAAIYHTSTYKRQVSVCFYRVSSMNGIKQKPDSRIHTFDFDTARRRVVLYSSSEQPYIALQLSYSQCLMVV